MKRLVKRNKGGFTLIEMIGVLAIIALLAGMLVPRIVQAIKEARVQSTVVSLNTLRAAVAQYYAKHGTLADLNSISDDLVSEGFLDKPLDVKIGSGYTFNKVTGSDAKDGANSTLKRYDLDGNGGYDTANASYVIEVRINGVSLEDAYKLSSAIDGSSLSDDPSSSDDNDDGANGNSDDVRGRVEYDFGSSGTSGTIYVYIAHE